MLFLTLCFVFVAVAAWAWPAGFSANLILLINMLLGALVASAFFLNVAALAMQANSSYVFLWPFVSFWLIFFVTVGSLRGATDMMARIRWKFPLPLEIAGTSLCSLLAAGLFTSLVAFSCHFAPLPGFYLKGSTSPGEGDSNLVWEQPWNQFFNFVSWGSLSEGFVYALPDTERTWVELNIEDATDDQFWSIETSLFPKESAFPGSNMTSRRWNPETLYGRFQVVSVALGATETLRYEGLTYDDEVGWKEPRR